MLIGISLRYHRESGRQGAHATVAGFVSKGSGSVSFWLHFSHSTGVHNMSMTTKSMTTKSMTTEVEDDE